MHRLRRKRLVDTEETLPQLYWPNLVLLAIGACNSLPSATSRVITGAGWVCENHPATPWDGDHACICGGAGMPCPDCNPTDPDHPPRPPAGTHVGFDKKGWRH